MCDPVTLRNARRAYLIAPAGCGKTHLIAEAVASGTAGRELILTHTHAGVNALRERLRELHAPQNSYAVETIAGWACRIAAAFPKTSEFTLDATPRNAEWNLVYAACVRFLRSSPARQIVTFSYGGLYVDEYQDCTEVQHELVLELAKLLPCRVLGDPLQGIFDFRGNKSVDWARDVEPTFEKLPDHTVPWRWQKSPELGEWLTEVRRTLLSEEPIDLTNLPASVRWVQLPATGSGLTVQREQCSSLATESAEQERCVAIHDALKAAACHSLGEMLGGRYDIIEAIDCKDLYEAALAIDVTEGRARAGAVLDFADLCFTRVGTTMRQFRESLRGYAAVDTAALSGAAYQDSLIELTNGGDLATVAKVLGALQTIKGARIKRREALQEMVRALREQGETAGKLVDAVWKVRSKTSMMGRPLRKLTIGRTVLVKGLQFEHALVLDADCLNPKSLYVALTRGSQTLTILSRSLTLNPYAKPVAPARKPPPRAPRGKGQNRDLPLFPEMRGA